MAITKRKEKNRMPCAPAQLPLAAVGCIYRGNRTTANSWVSSPATTSTERACAGMRHPVFHAMRQSQEFEIHGPLTSGSSRLGVCFRPSTGLVGKGRSDQNLFCLGDKDVRPITCTEKGLLALSDKLKRGPNLPYVCTLLL